MQTLFEDFLERKLACCHQKLFALTWLAELRQDGCSRQAGLTSAYDPKRKLGSQFSVTGVVAQGRLLHDLAVEMPVRMCEDRQHEREANERQQEAEHQGRCDDQSPQRHRERVRQHCFD